MMYYLLVLIQVDGGGHGVFHVVPFLLSLHLGSRSGGGDDDDDDGTG